MNPEESIERKECETCEGREWVIYFVDGEVIPERCPDGCDEGFAEDDSYDRHYDLRETEKTGN